MSIYCKRFRKQIICHLTNVNNPSVCVSAKKGEDVNRCLFPVYLIQTHFFHSYKSRNEQFAKVFFSPLAHGVYTFKLAINAMAIKL